jgi:hydrogenase expression/formation protein HypE
MKNKQILLAHGSGGKMSHKLIEDIFLKHFNNKTLKAGTDSAILKLKSQDKKLAFTTDSFVVNPIIFSGGDIGKLAVCGTLNDLAVSGAKPLYLTASFIIEEGLEIETLETIVKSMATEAKKAGVKIVTGDTKVVEKGKCDKIFINTAGIGLLDESLSHLSFGNNIQEGDKIIINGTIADHGMSIMTARENLTPESPIKSDCAPLNGLIQEALISSNEINFMRDATRGGLATVLVELAQKTSLGIEINEENIPISSEVEGICELLGFDPLHVANEGKIVLVVSEKHAEKVLKTLKTHKFGKNAAIIGEITKNHPQEVVLNTTIGGQRLLDMLSGEQLPRIC